MSVEEWKSALNWNRIPRFGPIHGENKESFKQKYYLSPDIEEVLVSLKLSLSEDYGATNKTIIGIPGSGKTTFAYFLKNVMSEDDTTFKKFFIQIIHFNWFVSSDNYEELIDLRVLELLKEYFFATGKDEIYLGVTAEQIPKREMLCRLVTYIKNEHSLDRRLIIVIDDIDETPSEVVEPRLRYFHFLLESHRIPKWLNIRETTLDNYESDFLEFIETKFGDRIGFPRVDLFGMINHRIEILNPEGVNPFIPEVCEYLLLAFEFDVRSASINAVKFLEQLEVPDLTSYSDKFIGHYFLKNFTKVMTKTRIFPNIFMDSESDFFPIERDLFLKIAIFRKFEESITDLILTDYAEFYKGYEGGKYADLVNFDVFSDEHFKNALNYLCNQRLIKLRRTGSTVYTLTGKGRLFVKFVREKLYTNFCRMNCDQLHQDKHVVFWELARRTPSEFIN